MPSVWASTSTISNNFCAFAALAQVEQHSVRVVIRFCVFVFLLCVLCIVYCVFCVFFLVCVLEFIYLYLNNLFEILMLVVNLSITSDLEWFLHSSCVCVSIKHQHFAMLRSYSVKNTRPCRMTE